MLRLSLSVVMIRRGNIYCSVVDEKPYFLGLEETNIFDSAVGLCVFLVLIVLLFFKREYVRQKYRCQSISYVYPTRIGHFFQKNNNINWSILLRYVSDTIFHHFYSIGTSEATLEHDPVQRKIYNLIKLPAFIRKSSFLRHSKIMNDRQNLISLLRFL